MFRDIHHPTGRVSRVGEAPPAETVLLAQPDPALREHLASSLRRSGYRVLTVTDGLGFLDRLGGLFKHGGSIDRPDIVVADARMVGLPSLVEFVAAGADRPWVFCTGDARTTRLPRVSRRLRFFPAPVDVEGLVAACDRVGMPKRVMRLRIEREWSLPSQDLADISQHLRSSTPGHEAAFSSLR